MQTIYHLVQCQTSGKTSISRASTRTKSTMTPPQSYHEMHENDDFDFASIERMIASQPPIDPECTPEAFRRILREAGFAADPPLVVRVKQPTTGDYIEFIESGGGWKRHDPAESDR